MLPEVIFLKMLVDARGAGTIVYYNDDAWEECSYCFSGQIWDYKNTDPFPHDHDCPILLTRQYLEDQ